MIRRPPRSTRTDHSFPTRRSSDLSLLRALAENEGQAPGELQVGNLDWPATLAGVFHPVDEHAEMLGDLLQGAVLVPELDLVGVLNRPLAVRVDLARLGHHLDRRDRRSREIGRASCRERVCQYV